MDRLKLHFPKIRLLFDTAVILIIAIFGIITFVNTISKAQAVVPLTTAKLPGTLFFTGNEEPCIGDCFRGIYAFDGSTHHIKKFGVFKQNWPNLQPSPDGNYLAWWSEPELYVGDLKTNETIRVAEKGLSAAWSPDSVHLAYKNDSSIFIYNIVDRSYLEIQTPGGKRFSSTIRSSLSWSPDGTRITFQTEDALFVVQIDNGQLTKLADLDSNRFEPQWSPVNDFIAYGNDGIYLVNASTSEEQYLNEGAHPVWSPDGQKIAFTNGDLLHIYELNTNQLSNFEPETIAEYQDDQFMILSDSLAWSPDSRYLAFGKFYLNNQKEFVYLIDSHQGILFPERIGPVVDVHELKLIWSPDGQYLAFINGVGTRGIWVVDVVSRKPNRLPMSNLYLGFITDLVWIP